MLNAVVPPPPPTLAVVNTCPVDVLSTNTLFVAVVSLAETYNPPDTTNPSSNCASPTTCNEPENEDAVTAVSANELVTAFCAQLLVPNKEPVIPADADIRPVTLRSVPSNVRLLSTLAFGAVPFSVIIPLSVVPVRVKVPLVPDVPELPLVPLVPLLPDVPDVPELPEAPLVPEVPELPDVPLVPELPEVPFAPEVPELPRVPDVPELPDVPLVPELPATPDVPELPDEPFTPDVPLDPETPPVPELPEIPDVPDEPELPVAPEVPLVPDVPLLPLIPEVPLVPDVPELPLVPEVPELPLVPLVPDVPLLPFAPEVPLVPDGVIAKLAVVANELDTALVAQLEVPNNDPVTPPPLNRNDPVTNTLPLISTVSVGALLRIPTRLPVTTNVF